jgi:hypothetical protein
MIEVSVNVFAEFTRLPDLALRTPFETMRV